MASLDLMISQYRQQSGFGQLLNVMLEQFLDEISTVTKLQAQVSVNTAVGVWLDYVASRVGLRRPTDSTNIPAFGFDEAGRPFKSAPFRGQTPGTAVGISDESFRPLVKARFIALTSSGGPNDILRCARFIDPEATLHDNKDLSITLFSDQVDALKRAYALGCIPVAAGVLLKFLPQSYFGFDEAGQPFGSAPLRGSNS